MNTASKLRQKYFHCIGDGNNTVFEFEFEGCVHLVLFNHNNSGFFKVESNGVLSSILEDSDMFNKIMPESTSITPPPLILEIDKKLRAKFSDEEYIEFLKEEERIKNEPLTDEQNKAMSDALFSAMERLLKK